MERVRVLIVEDEPLFREMLQLALSADSQIEVVASFSNAADTLAALDSLSFDVATLDIQLSGEMNGHQLGIRLRRHSPHVGIVLLSNYLESAFLRALRRNGSVGWSYLLKDSVKDLAALQRAVKGAARGDIVLDGKITSLLRAKKESGVAQLTERELEILSLIAEGYSNRAIADRLVIAVKSVENAITRIFQKLDIDSANQEIQPRVAAVLDYLRNSRLGSYS